MFTPEQKLAEIKRELGFRHRVYAVQMAEHPDRREDLERRKAVMEAIRDDYERCVAEKRPQLAL